MENTRLEMYISEFGEPPYLLTMMTYDSPFYKELMANAILRGEPLTPKEIEINAEAMGIQYDIKEPTQEDIQRHTLNKKYNGD